MPIWEQARYRQVVERILNKGMVRDLPVDQSPRGIVYTAKDFYIESRGPRRRRAFVELLDSSYTVDYPPIQGIVVFWKTDGTAVTLVWDMKFVYEVTASAGFVGKYLTYSTGTVSGSVGTTTVTGSGTDWSSDVKYGDVIVIDPSGTAEELEIYSATATEITTKTALANTYSGADYEIRKAFGSTSPYKVDAILLRNEVVFVGNGRYALSYDGSSYGQFSGTYDAVVGCGMHFLDRLWFGHITSGGTEYRQKITWSKTTDKTDFSHGYDLSLPYTQGFVRRLVPMGPLAVAYFTDAVWVGRQTGVAGDALPLAFTQVGKAGLGLVGDRAVVAWGSYHYFVGSDNIYRFSNKGLEELGTPVLSKTVRECNYPENIITAPDPANNRIVFGFPKDYEQISELWFFNYQIGAWSYAEFPVQMLALSAIINAVTFDDVSTTWDNIDDTYPNWAAVGDTSGVKRYLIVGNNDRLYVQASSGEFDAGDVPINAVLETVDYDENVPNRDKLWSRLSLKLTSAVSDDIMFSVWFSTNKGVSWESVGDMTISSGTNEAYINFKARGSTIRFRFTTTSQVEPFIIDEIVRRVVVRGLETSVED